jgi:Protein of unknown function (DUF1631)
MTPEQTTIFQHCLKTAADGGPALFEQLLAGARTAAEMRAVDHWGTAKAEAMKEGPALLNRYAPVLEGAFGAALMCAFLNPTDQEPVRDESVKTPSLSNLRFDQLELMDDELVDESVESTRVEQAATAEAELALGELSALMCSVQGLPFVQLERNPLRPASYVAALQSLFTQVDVTEAVRADWLQLMGLGLGRALNAVYLQLCEILVAAGISPADYNVIPSAPAPLSPMPMYGSFNARRLPGRGGAGMGLLDGPGDQSGQGFSVLNRAQIRHTIEQLRRLIAGETKPVAQDSGFDHTMPAALEALQQMQQVDQAMARMAGRPTPVLPQTVSDGRRGQAEPPLGATQGDGSGSTVLFESLRQQAHSVGQVLGLEAVSLMVENLAKDVRLLPPVQDVVRSLTTPLLRLAMVDSRFFNDKEHPARQLLDAIVAQGIRFDTVNSTPFMAFIQPLKRVVDELQHVPVENAEPFALSLANLMQLWADKAQSEGPAHPHNAGTILDNEVQKKRLAEKISQQIRARGDAGMVPVPVLEFATGPWALAMAHARLASPGHDGAEDLALVDNLFWSTRPVLAKTDPTRLVQLIPGMLTRIRAGLRAIEYPKPAIGEFFEMLMALHQKALVDKSTAQAGAVAAVHRDSEVKRPVPAPAATKATPGWLSSTHEPRASSFLDGFDFRDFSEAHATEPMAYVSAGVTSVMASVSASTLDVDAAATNIEIGSWVEMTIGGNTMRAQLVWCSPEGNNFMFTTSTGRNQSMTRRSVDALIQRGMVKLLQRQGGPGDVAIPTQKT